MTPGSPEGGPNTVGEPDEGQVGGNDDSEADTSQPSPDEGEVTGSKEDGSSSFSKEDMDAWVRKAEKMMDMPMGYDSAKSAVLDKVNSAIETLRREDDEIFQNKEGVGYDLESLNGATLDQLESLKDKVLDVMHPDSDNEKGVDEKKEDKDEVQEDVNRHIDYFKSNHQEGWETSIEGQTLEESFKKSVLNTIAFGASGGNVENKRYEDWSQDDFQQAYDEMTDHLESIGAKDALDYFTDEYPELN